MEIFVPPLIQAQSWQEAQRKFNEVIRQMARMLNNVYSGFNVRDVDGTTTISQGLLVGAIGSQKIGTGTEVEITSTTYTDLSGITITRTFKKSKVLIAVRNVVHCDAYTDDPYGSCSMRIAEDSNYMAETTMSSDVLNADMGMFTLDVISVAAGEHTIKAQWKVGSSNQTWDSTAREMNLAWWNVL